MAHSPLALTMGDPAGIGPDITLKLWSARAKNDCPAFVLYGDSDMLVARAQQLQMDVPVKLITEPAKAAAIFATQLPVIPIELEGEVIVGKTSPAHAKAIIGSIEAAIAAVKCGAASGVVTNPIAKETLYRAGFKHPGHTEFLAHLAKSGEVNAPVQPVMMLASDELRVVPLTIHIPLKEVATRITAPLIRQTVHITHGSLCRDFAIESPRLAITGLNPHAGEGGTMGREETEIIAPAIAELKRQGIDVTGPHPADTLFHANARRNYDAVIAMYHDQALVPIKTIAFDSGVNVTLGLPFVRTSPDHGTAFDIAGTGSASPTSVLAALLMAQRMVNNRDAARERASGALAATATTMDRT